ncbi:hypothetical protein AAVH_00061 [Aphelenchoides avenae]|nr:hypothetical protein AAVH_00061 [Aphelenchus avenae]
MWDGFKPYAKDEREGRDLWNLKFTYPSNNPLPPLTIYMDDKVKFKCSTGGKAEPMIAGLLLSQFIAVIAVV